MALWPSVGAVSTKKLPEELGRDAFEEEILGNLIDLGGINPYDLAPRSCNVGSRSVGDEIEDYPIPEVRPGPLELRATAAEYMRQKIMYGSQRGDQRSMVSRYRARNGNVMHNAPTAGGDVKPIIISEERLAQMGMVTPSGQPVNLLANNKNIVSDRCTCIKYI